MRALLALALALVLVPVTAAADTLDDVKAYYKATKQMTADFEQEVTNATFGTSSTSSGTIELKRKAKMRWEYRNKRTGDAQKLFISNGKKLWFVDHGNKQWSEQKLADTVLPAAVSFLTGKGDLKHDFTAATDTSGTYGDSSHTVVELTPKAASAQYKRIYLVVEAGGRVAESVVIDPSDNVNHFRFANPDTTTKIPESRFKPDKSKLRKYRRIS